MEIDPEFLAHVRHKAIHKWKWRNPYVAALLAFAHPLGILPCSVPAALICTIVWLLVYDYYRPNRPIGIGILLASACGLFAYYKTIWKNAAIEKWKYGLPGTGKQNPRKVGAEILAEMEHTRLVGE